MHSPSWRGLKQRAAVGVLFLDDKGIMDDSSRDQAFIAYHWCLLIERGTWLSGSSYSMKHLYGELICLAVCHLGL